MNSLNHNDLLKTLSLNIVTGEGNDTPLQYSCLANPMDGGAWWAAVDGVAQSQTRLNDFTFTFHFPALEKEMATHSSVLVWRIPGTAEPGGLPSMGSHRVGHDWSDLAAAAAANIVTVRLRVSTFKFGRGTTQFIAVYHGIVGYHSVFGWPCWKLGLLALLHWRNTSALWRIYSKKGLNKASALLHNTLFKPLIMPLVSLHKLGSCDVQLYS